jgi:hypothetical protein
MADVMQHVEALAGEIGPRPATSEAESRAAAYLEAVFNARGLETEVQTFDTPRTYGWAYVIYHVLALGSAGLLGLGDAWNWVALALSAITAFFFAMDLDTRWGLSHLMPKGVSRNVIARHIPRSRRGDRLRKVVVVAHYDSARASLAFSPGLVKNFNVTFGLLKIITFGIPVFALAIALPWTNDTVDKYLWYACLAFSAYLLVPLFINIHRELAMKFVDGANDNASGVAAMLAVMEELVPEPDSSRYVTSSFTPVRRSAEAAIEAEVVPEGALLTYTPANGEAGVLDLPDDFAWAEVEEMSEAGREQSAFEFGSVDFGGGAPGGPDDDLLEAGDMASESRRGGLLGRFGGGAKREPQRPRRAPSDSASASDWLGVDEGFNARKEGGKIGSWDNFTENGDVDESGWKGGWAGEDPIEDEDFAAAEAARIRRRVTETVDRDLTEKEVWFVATSAEEVGTFGMQAFLREYGDDVRDAFILNLDNVGSGALYWVTEEGMLRKYRPDRRLTGLAKRVSREHDIMVKPRVYRGLSTDATPALARGYKAMSIMAFDSDGTLPNWHWETDTVDRVDPALIELAAQLVGKMIREI